MHYVEQMVSKYIQVVKTYCYDFPVFLLLFLIYVSNNCLLFGMFYILDDGLMLRNGLITPFR